MDSQLLEDLEDLIHSRVGRGQYATRADAIRDIAAWLREQEHDPGAQGPTSPPRVALPRGMVRRLRHLRDARFLAVGPWSIGSGVVLALAMTQSGAPHPWIGLLAGYLAATALLAWALAEPTPASAAGQGDG